jgi:hypothetical protein
MIISEFYKGQGFGNQLWVYAAIRSLAEKLNIDYSLLSSSRFKGSAFLDLPFGSMGGITSAKIPHERFPGDTKYYLQEELCREAKFNFDISGPDRRLLNLESNTFIDGNLQSLTYIREYREKIQNWFHVEGESFDGCVINFRGGEYKGISNVFLPKKYYLAAIEMMKETNPQMKFLVVTDDEKKAREYFPEYPIVSSGGVKIYFHRIYVSPHSSLIGRDFRILQNAKYLILSNSSFSWWGAWSSQTVKRVIAPKFWAAHNVSNGFWSTGDIAEESWEWIERGQYQLPNES